MGLYDTVYFRCPYCGAEMSAQSKGGDCKLRDYYIENAPEDVMKDVNRHAPHYCPECGKKVEIKIKLKIVKEEENE